MKINKEDLCSKTVGKNIWEQLTDDLIDDIIETVLRFVLCDHEKDEDEDGTRVTTFFSVDKGCEEAVREILEK